MSKTLELEVAFILVMREINPQDEIKGSISNPSEPQITTFHSP
jgi:hypothetical protein